MLASPTAFNDTIIACVTSGRYIEGAVNVT